MKFVWRWFRRIALAFVALVVLLILPIIYVETACQGYEEPAQSNSIVTAPYQRTESRTLMTYPEWHIVHAYEEYGQTISERDPHDFQFLKSITGFWSSLCAVTTKSAALGDIDFETRQMVYVIGSSFSVELLFKALYEETVGRVTTWIRGSDRSSLDTLSAEHAVNYAKFLQQVPWYQWKFLADANELNQFSSGSARDTERKFALGIEYKAKAGYAKVIASAVEGVGADELTLRMIITGVTTQDIASYEEISLVAGKVAGFEQALVIEVPRYRALTLLLERLANEGAEFVEIAGNDEILYTALSKETEASSAFHSIQRQGFNDYRHLFLVAIPELAGQLRRLSANGLTLEHIHDY